jgi:hypothetical protein
MRVKVVVDDFTAVFYERRLFLGWFFVLLYSK